MSATSIALADNVRNVALPKRRQRQLHVLFLLLSDVAAICLALSVAFILVQATHLYHGQTMQLLPAHKNSLVLLLLLPVMFTVVELYSPISLHPTAEFRRLVLAASAACLCLFGLSFSWVGSEAMRPFLLFTWTASVTMLPLSRSAIRFWGARYSWFGSPTVLFGAGAAGQTVLKILRKQTRIGLRPVAVLDEREPDLARFGHSDLAADDFSSAAEWSQYARQAVVTVSDFSKPVADRILKDYAQHFERVLVIPDVACASSLWVTACDIGGVLALDVRQNLMSRQSQALKRLCDICLAVCALVLLFPLIVLVAIAVKLASSGPLFFGQERIGRHNRPFTIWKFRSMRVNGDRLLQEYLKKNEGARREWELVHKLRHDPRITAVGSFLRRTSLDEIPQLWNVLIGDMSLVGPRPIVYSEVPKYREVITQYLRVRPGITGLWQVSGRNNTTYDERVSFDRYYVQNWSIWLDLHILCSTARAVFSARGAY